MLCGYRLLCNLSVCRCVHTCTLCNMRLLKCEVSMLLTHARYVLPGDSGALHARAEGAQDLLRHCRGPCVHMGCKGTGVYMQMHPPNGGACASVICVEDASTKVPCCALYGVCVGLTVLHRSAQGGSQRHRATQRCQCLCPAESGGCVQGAQPEPHHVSGHDPVPRHRIHCICKVCAGVGV